ncbi:class A beta-lactamase-related serine hydrolase [Streptomyces sp. RS10V-4]|uniref:serine hydrolase n=1 Tax=Streptomyces rhizoryzae TaxID=2932493 RepID=UPI00200537CA|nr:serine hydrolase [Streptomyces rhizoryzae]MCK7623001.1 class A beta-lactamase-related serine hydrolase [Streptomyces rhizoryzae]
MLSLALAPWRRPPVLLRNADVPHYAASTMKVAVLAAVHRSGLAPDREIPVVNRFRSAAGGTYAHDPAQDSDPAPWELLGRTAPLGWLAARMVSHSSNLATSLCTAAVGPEAVAEVWRRAGASAASGSPRGIEDAAARAAGIDNTVTAHDLLRLLASLEPAVLARLEDNAHAVDLAAGLPPGTRLASKNGWVDGVRHSAAVVRPPDAPPYVLAVCYTGPLANGQDTGDPAARLLARLSARVWDHRHRLAGPAGS